MATWTDEEMKKIGAAEEVELASLRRDGTLSKAVIMWVVRADDALYVRAANGREALWFRRALEQLAGRIYAGGVVKDVTFVEEHEPTVNDQIDAAYLSKYSRYPQYVAPMVTPAVKAATLRLVPRGRDESQQ
jgi:hypothetical protein